MQNRASLIAAILVVGLGAAGATQILSTVGFSELGQVAAGGVLMGFSWIHRSIRSALARFGAPRTAGEGDGGEADEGYEGFDMPWYTMLAYGTCVFAAALEAAGFVAGVTVGLIGGDVEDLSPVIGVDTVIVAATALFFLGSWIGARCERLGVLILLAMAVLGRLVVALIDYLVLNAEDFEQVFGVERNAANLAVLSLGGSAMFAVLAATFGLVGFWRGRRTRPARYLQFLLRQIPEETRETIVEMAYEEVRRREGLRLAPPPARAVPAIHG